METLVKYLIEFRLLRLMLLASALVSLVLRPPAVVDPVYEGWNVLVHLLLPVLAPIQFMLLMLDVLMCGVMKVDKPLDERARLTRIQWTEAAAALLLLAVWLPYYVTINLPTA